MPADVSNAFDVAFFFADMALAENEYLQPQKLQGLMFLAQSYYVAAFKGRKLMPAVFVADERGPLEPNVYMAFSKGRPDIDADLFLPHEVESFLDGIWRRTPVRSVTDLGARRRDHRNVPTPLDQPGPEQPLGHSRTAGIASADEEDHPTDGSGLFRKVCSGSSGPIWGRSDRPA